GGSQNRPAKNWPGFFFPISSGHGARPAGHSARWVLFILCRMTFGPRLSSRFVSLVRSLRGVP
ncbi:unnamed protein product, partial [Amoebophrya sp. A120]